MAGLSELAPSGLERRRLAQATTERLRDLILDQAPDTLIGSLKDLAQRLGVGIVTVQQAARVLEHEGLLEVRRGPGGGYIGKRPDEAALVRALAAYIRVHGSAYLDALDMMSLLNCELVAAAAGCGDPALQAQLRALIPRIDGCETMEQRIALEQAVSSVMFSMVDRPIVQLLARVTSSVYQANPIPPVYVGEEGVAEWKAGRHRLIEAVLRQDEELARFEAMRMRQLRLSALKAQRAAGSAS